MECPPTSYSVIGNSVNFNNGALINQGTSCKSGHGVTITRLPPGSIITKVLLKAVTKKAKKDPKTFTLRSINTVLVRSPDLLEKETINR